MAPTRRSGKKPGSHNKPTHRDIAFVEFYTTEIGISASAAARKAGFSESYCKNSAHLLPSKPQISALIAQKMAPAMEENNVTRATILKRVAEKFFAKDASASEVGRLGKLLAEMTVGALVPINVQHTGLSLEEFMAQATNPQGDVPATKKETVQ